MDTLDYWSFVNIIKFLSFSDSINLIKSNKIFQDYAKKEEAKSLLQQQLDIDKYCYEKSVGIHIDTCGSVDKILPKSKKYYKSMQDRQIIYLCKIQGDEINEWLDPTARQDQEIRYFFDNFMYISNYEKRYFDEDPYLLCQKNYVTYLINERTGIKRKINYMKMCLDYHLGADDKL